MIEAVRNGEQFICPKCERHYDEHFNIAEDFDLNKQVTCDYCGCRFHIWFDCNSWDDHRQFWNDWDYMSRIVED